MSEYFRLGNGEKLFLEEYGVVSHGSADSTHTVMALHGLGGGGYFFAGVGRSIGNHGRVMCPDLPGSGLSQRGERPISFEMFADAVVEVIDRKTHRPIALMGHSMGTIVALKAYARVPNRIGSLIFAVSTFDTDYVLVKQECVEKAVQALREAGHEEVQGQNP